MSYTQVVRQYIEFRLIIISKSKRKPLLFLSGCWMYILVQAFTSITTTISLNDLLVIFVVEFLKEQKLTFGEKLALRQQRGILL